MTQQQMISSKVQIDQNSFKSKDKITEKNGKKSSKETQIKLLNFFNDRIDPVEMAKTLRQVNFTMALCVLSEHETFQSEIIKLRDSFYWLNELAETLNPYLELE